MVGKMKVFKTKKFILRPAKLSDAENIYKYQQDEGTQKNFMSTPKNVEEVKKELRNDFRDRKKPKNKRDGEEWTIEIDGEASGQISIYFHDKRNRSKAKLSAWIARKHRNKGIMTKILKIFTGYTFKKYNLVRLEGYVREYNKPSARMMEKAGYKLEGIIRKNQKKEGRYVNDLLYAKVK
ncbi:hypothetical protein COU61_00780 [Candidatus Pacearchaeota archaeon CG10_big_fil_rev_8_21_14_0_10_35_13]|nr:MAG: hypothetical protein COU61_00780 [Candidatus Pacearchaeota archaeon CG10_big_fil_rev_8_21_14_0_10_35_13]